MLLIGVQPVELEDYGGSLRSAVKAQIPCALNIARDYLAGHGIHLTEASTPCQAGVITPGLELANYERDRPDQDSACRVGDARVLTRARRG